MLIAVDLAKFNLPECDEPIQHGQRGVLGAERRLGLRAPPELTIEILERVRGSDRLPRRPRETAHSVPE